MSPKALCTVALAIVMAFAFAPARAFADDIKDCQKKYDDILKSWEKYHDTRSAFSKLEALRDGEVKYCPDGPEKEALKKAIEEKIVEIKLYGQKASWEQRKKDFEHGYVDLKELVDKKDWDNVAHRGQNLLRTIKDHDMIKEATDKQSQIEEWIQMARGALQGAAAEAQMVGQLKRVDEYIAGMEKLLGQGDLQAWSRALTQEAQYARRNLAEQVKPLNPSDPRIAEREKRIEGLCTQLVEKALAQCEGDMKEALAKTPVQEYEVNRIIEAAEKIASDDPRTKQIRAAGTAKISEQQAARADESAKLQKWNADLVTESNKLWERFSSEMKSAQSLVDLRTTRLEEVRGLTGRWTLHALAGEEGDLHDGWYNYGSGPTIAYKWNPLTHDMWNHVRAQADNSGGGGSWQICGKILGTTRVPVIGSIDTEVPYVEVMAVKTHYFCAIPGYGTNVDKVPHYQGKPVKIDSKYLSGGFEGLSGGPSWLSVLISRVLLSLGLLFAGLLLSYDFWEGKVPALKAQRATLEPLRPMAGLAVLGLGVASLFFCYGWVLVGDVVPASAGIVSGFLLASEIIKAKAKEQAAQLGGDRSAQLGEMEAKLKAAVPTQILGFAVMGIGLLHLIAAQLPLF